MIKFLLGLIALIVVLLAVYIVTSKPSETLKKTIVTEVTKKKELKTVSVVKEVQKQNKSKAEREVSEGLDSVISNAKKDLILEEEPKLRAVDEYNIAHPRYDVDEEQILLEVNGEAKIKLDEETLQKIELEVKDFTKLTN